jgi:hypothetical protein
MKDDVTGLAEEVCGIGGQPMWYRRSAQLKYRHIGA